SRLPNRPKKITGRRCRCNLPPIGRFDSDARFCKPPVHPASGRLHGNCSVEIKKAIITAAGKSQRTLPLQTLVDRDGVTKTALRIIIEEILSAGVEEICIIISPGDQEDYSAAAGGRSARLQFVEQKEALGYGHAV